MNEAASPRIRKTMVFVLLALFLGQFGSGVYDLVFSNFLRDAQHLDVEMRGLIECPRELPGILSLFVVSLLFMFNEVRVAGVACLLMFGGMYALAFCGAGTSLWTLSAWILTVSLGQHILMGMIDTIVIHTARPENRSLRLAAEKAEGDAPLIGQTPAMERLRNTIRHIANTDVDVLVAGETGSGKEVVATLLHRWSRRASGHFVALNCGALPESVIEAELFCHEAGAFTGAQKKRMPVRDRAIIANRPDSTTRPSINQP